MSYSILHLDSETGWRGGQRQVKLLIQGLNKKSFNCYFMGPKSGVLFQKLQADFPCIPLNMKGMSQLLASLKLKAYCNKNDIDLIDCHSSGAHSVAYFASLMGMKVPIVVHRRVDYTPKSFGSKSKYFSPAIHRYIAISKYIGKVLEDFGIPSSKITVVRSAVKDRNLNLSQKRDTQAAIRKKYNIPDGTKLILNTAALTEQKDHKTLIKSAAMLKKKALSFHLLICGDGHLKGEVRQQIRDEGLEECVTLCGHVDNIYDYYLAADIFAISSVDEGLGTSILDAIQFCLPIVATSAGGIPEIVTHHHSGLLSDPKDHLQFSAQMSELLANEALAETVVKNASEHLKQNFKLQNMIKGNAEVYEDVLDEFSSRT